MDPRPPLPPFTHETAVAKVQAVEDAWNTCDPERVAGAYSPDTVWRNRDEHLRGRDEVVTFLTRKWEKERDYRLRKNLWAFSDNRIAVGCVVSRCGNVAGWAMTTATTTTTTTTSLAAPHTATSRTWTRASAPSRRC